MPTVSSVIACAAFGLLLWAPAGWALARRLFACRAFALAAAPALGWAAQNVLALALASVLGLSPAVSLGASLLCLLIGLAWPRGAAPAPAGAPRPSADAHPEDEPGARAWLQGLLPPRRPARGLRPDGALPFSLLPALLLVAASGFLALGPAAAILPKVQGDTVALAAPIYDHAKVALVDALMISGVPPANPVYGTEGGAGHVAYYYLWHFGAAQTGLLASATGWAADAASTWYSAFAVFLLVAGLAVRLAGGGALAPALALAAAAAGSLRPVLELPLGRDLVDGLLAPAAGFGGVLFQASWSPHHVASAACVVLAVLLLARLAQGADLLGALVLGLVAAAGFQASLWVGGVTFVLAGAAATLALLPGLPRGARGGFLIGLGLAGAVAAAFSAPLLLEQIHAASARGADTPVVLSAYPVLGPLLAGLPGRQLLETPAFLLFLAVELPAAALLGGLGLARLLGTAGADGPDRRLVRALAGLTLASIAVTALLRSTAGVNNDLGWRAILPAALVLSACAGAQLARWAGARAFGRLGAGLLVLALGLPASFSLVASNLAGNPSPQGAVFARDPDLWEEVRRLVGPDERLASNPARMGDLTPWPINISWALLSRRRSCYGGEEMALAFAPLTQDARAAASALFNRVFAGTGSATDLDALRGPFGCRFALLTAGDGAYGADPFAASPHFRLVAQARGRWRLYRATAPGAGDPAPGASSQ